MTTEKRFPIMVGREGTAAACPSWIPWDVIAPYEGHALANHDQTLERLAQRGGLDPIEAYLVMTGRRWKGETFNKAFEVEACNFLDKIVRDRGELETELAQAKLELGDLREDLERARTYTGLEAQGCPLCTYVQGAFLASCSFHKKLEELQKIVDAAVELVKWHGAGALKSERYDRLFSLAGNYHLKTEGKPQETQKGEPFKMPLCDVQVGCFGQCGNLLPCEDHPAKEANSCTCTPGGGGLCSYCRSQDANMG